MSKGFKLAIVAIVISYNLIQWELWRPGNPLDEPGIVWAPPGINTIQSKIDNLPPTGGVIYLAKGTYTTTRTLRLDKDDSAIVGKEGIDSWNNASVIDCSKIAKNRLCIHWIGKNIKASNLEIKESYSGLSHTNEYGKEK